MSQLKFKFFHFSYTRLLKPILFKFDPEKIHDAFLKIGNILGKFSFTRSLCRWAFSYQNPNLHQEIAGIKFKNPVGLSAGFDKNGEIVNITPEVGFSFMQVGTVTHHSYKGNPKPRLIRLPKSKSLIVNYGLKNIGTKKILQNIKKSRKKEILISFSIGKTNCKENVDSEKGITDYLASAKEIQQSKLGDFYTLNISCPNTFGGEPDNNPQSFEKLLKEITKLKLTKKIFVKMPLNKSWNKFKELLDLCIQYKVTGVIIANLNKEFDQPQIIEKIPKGTKGGISGITTQKLSNDLIFKTYKDYGKKLRIIGVGGIFSAEDAYEKIKNGASLVQLITGMIFEGPQLIGQINQGLVDLMEKDGYKNISEAVGANHK